MLRRPFSLAAMAASAACTLAIATILDTDYYEPTASTMFGLPNTIVFTPWNNLDYNLDPANLAQHGTHPYYQHLLVNLPQLLGPAFPLLFTSFRPSTQLYAALSAILLLSCFSHQEARFLVPAVPLLLSSVELPVRFVKAWLAAWLGFNVALGILMGIYHQGGIVPAQLWLSGQDTIQQALWWKTLSPPNYLLGSKTASMQTFDLMGMPGVNMTADISKLTQCNSGVSSVLIAPHSATFLDQYIVPSDGEREIETDVPFTLERIWSYKNHLNMDDIDPLEEGLQGTLKRVVGRRGLNIWKIHKDCK